MTIAERIMELVNDNGGNMSDFAKMINVTPAYISKLKNNLDSVPSDRTINDICRVFDVSEEWLRTGKGTKRLPKTREKEIADLAKELLYAEEDDFKSALIECIAGMPADMIEYLKDFTLDYAERIKEKELP